MKYITPSSTRLLRSEEQIRVSIITLIALLLAGTAFGEDQTMRDKLTGKWLADGNGETWTLKEKGDSIHVSNSSATKTVAEFDCNTRGEECAIKHAGHSSKVSIWFNGAKLVELETTGSQVVKRRFAVTGDGNTMELETIPVVPSGSSETTHFKRDPSGTSKQ